jgi:hypothetical protein
MEPDRCSIKTKYFVVVERRERFLIRDLLATMDSSIADHMAQGDLPSSLVDGIGVRLYVLVDPVLRRRCWRSKRRLDLF